MCDKQRPKLITLSYMNLGFLESLVLESMFCDYTVHKKCRRIRKVREWYHKV